MRLLNEAIDSRLKLEKKSVLNILIDNYSKELDSWQLDSIINDMLYSRDDVIIKLRNKFKIQEVYELLIKFIVEELGFSNTVDNLLEYNYKDSYSTYTDFDDWKSSILLGAICREQYTLTRKTFSVALFSRVKFNSDVILDVEIIPEQGFSRARFNRNNKLIIKDGCKEIKENALYLISCDDIYLPSSLTRFEYSELSMVKNVHYDGTKSDFIKLLDVSEWWDVVDSVGSDVYCVDDRIRWNEVIN